MKKTVKIVAIVCVVLVIGFFGYKLVNKCDNCGKIFIGPGYEATVISDTLAKGDQILCKACAEKNHAIELALGKDLADFRRGLLD